MSYAVLTYKGRDYQPVVYFQRLLLLLAGPESKNENDNVQECEDASRSVNRCRALGTHYHALRRWGRHRC